MEYHNYKAMEFVKDKGEDEGKGKDERPEEQDEEEEDNIWIAVSNGDIARVKHLVLVELVKVNVQDDHGYSPL